MTTTNINTGVNSQLTVRKDKYGRRVYKNRISAAMAGYREDFRDNREWWETKMGTGRNNEYLWIQYRNGDSVVIDSNYFEEHTALPRFRADEVDYISRFFGDGIETTTAANIEIDTDRITLYCDGVEFFRMEMTAEQYKEMREAINAAIDNEEDATKAMISFCMNLAQKAIEAEKRTAIESAKATAEAITTTPENETTMATTDTINNVLAALKSELQEYHNNAAKGGANRRRNMVLLAWDIRRIERKLTASTMRGKIKALMLSAGYVLANGSTLKDHTKDANLLQYLDSVAWVCLQNDTLSICNA